MSSYPTSDFIPLVDHNYAMDWAMEEDRASVGSYVDSEADTVSLPDNQDERKYRVCSHFRLGFWSIDQFCSLNIIDIVVISFVAKIRLRIDQSINFRSI
jgi:hypothetical protein